MSNEPETAPEPFSVPPRKRKPRAPSTPTPGLLDAQARGRQVMQEAGRLLPVAPTNADDIMTAWKMGRDEAYGTRVKVFRQPKGQGGLSSELVDEMPLLDYALEPLAANHGPGLYFVRGTGAYVAKVFKFNVSESYATRAGWGRAPVKAPEPADLLAVQTVQKLEAGERVDQVNLLAAIDRIVKANIEATVKPQPQAAPATFESQFDQMFRMFELTDRLEKRAAETMARRMGLEEKEERPQTTTEMLLGLLPQALDMFGKFMQNRNPAPMPQPPMMRRTVSIPNRPPQPQAPAEPAPIKETQPMRPISDLSEQDLQTLKDAGELLGQFGPALSMLLEKTGMDSDAAVADELGSGIPAMFYPRMVSLAELVERHPWVMLEIHPALSSPRWPAIVGILRAKIEATNG